MLAARRSGRLHRVCLFVSSFCGRCSQISSFCVVVVVLAERRGIVLVDSGDFALLPWSTAASNQDVVEVAIMAAANIHVFVKAEQLCPLPVVRANGKTVVPFIAMQWEVTTSLLDGMLFYNGAAFLSETQKELALKTPPVDTSIVENAVAARGGWGKLLHSSKSNGLSSSSATKGGLIGAFFT